MGTFETKGAKLTDTIKNNQEEKNIPPFRMNLLMKAASDVTNTLINNKHLYNPTYEECEIIMEIVGRAIDRSKNE